MKNLLKFQKTAKQVYYILGIAIMSIITSCHNESDYVQTQLLDTDSEIQKGINPETTELTAEDAKIVALMYNCENNTRSVTHKDVKNVVAIRDEKGEPSIYAVNFNKDGYILVSATTRYYPILAEVEHGEYSLSMPETGQQIVIGDMLSNIKLAKDNKYDFNCQPLWCKYIETEIPEMTTRTSSDYNEEFNNWYASQAYGNYRIMKLKSCKNILPDNVYAEFVSAAETEDLWEGTEYSWQNTAYVVERTTENVDNIGPLLKTHWAQGGTFNNSGYEHLGCVTIATGQIMRFFEFPESYDWVNMPDDFGNGVLANFLTSLRFELGVSSGGSASIGDAERVLKSKGYIRH